MAKSPQDLTAEKTEKQESKASRWKLPDVSISGLQKVGEKISEQTVGIATDAATNTHELASRATEQALRSSIDQTMSAFQIAVEKIYERKIPAEKTALTGTINVGVIQLSIRVDIPMDEETGEIEIKVE